MTTQELYDAVSYGQLIWNDPDPIEGNDYTVTKIWDISHAANMAMIHYGEGSEAGVYLNELEITPYSVKKKDSIECILLLKFRFIDMNIPSNYEDIVQFVYEDVCETADPLKWNNDDVTTGFRRWIEKNN